MVLSVLSFYFYNSTKDNDVKFRVMDRKLAEHYFESITDRNDGWTKKHYRELYDKRLRELKEKV